MTEPACTTCRARKVKCDRGKPICGACVRLKLDCRLQGPTKILWLKPFLETGSTMSNAVNSSASNDDSDTGSRRLPLYTDADRESDCMMMTSAVPLAHIDRTMELLDDAGKSLSARTIGPFTVFGASTANTMPDESSSELVNPNVDNAPDDLVFDFSSPNNSGTIDTAPLTPWLRSIFAEDPHTAQIDMIGDDDPVDFIGNYSQNTGAGLVEPGEIDLSNPSPSKTMVPLHVASDTGDISLTTFQRLLEHYKSSIVRLLSYSQLDAKSPWKVLYLPYVLETFAEMTLFGDSANNARMAVLFAALSTSAYNLENLQQGVDVGSSEDLSLGELFRKRSKLRLQKCLQEQCSGTKKAKYKEVLMAFLSAVTMCVVSGQMQDARAYLLDAEKFIYFCGFNKRHKSRKIQMLHSIYVYLRIFSETAYNSPAATIESPSNNSETSPSSTESESNTSYRFPSAWGNRLQSFKYQQPQQDDAEFESQLVAAPGGMYEPSIIEQIYQVPESMFRLISHTTQLANDAARIKGGEAYHRRVKQLESEICDYRNPYLFMVEMAPCSDRPLFTKLSFHFSTAIYSAVIIYFYQRVRDVHSTILQQYVNSTIYHLLELENLKKDHGDTSANICWPGFIAGTAATGVESRNKISSWLLRSGQKSGLKMFLKAREALLQLWKEMSESNTAVSWIDMLEREGSFLVLT